MDNSLIFCTYVIEINQIPKKMITPQQLQKEQERIWTLIKERAIKDGLMEDKESDLVWPIYDGVADFERYLSSKPRIMVILKEPYDDYIIDNDGNKVPCGGGWSIPEAMIKSAEEKKWKVKTWQRVIYAIYGLLNNLHYRDMDYIREEPSMGNVLLGISWINLSKMPGFKQSYDSLVRENCLKHWQEIIKEQIDVYDPEVIIFAGTLYKQNDFYYTFFTDEDWNHRDECVKNENGKPFMTKYIKDGRLIIDALHPGLRNNVELWVDSIIDAIKEYTLNK